MFSSNTSQVSSDAVFVEDIFQSWLYTGNGSTQTITNGIDLAGEGGMVWTKARSTTNKSHMLFDTIRGETSVLFSNLTGGQVDTTSLYGKIGSFNSNGYSIVAGPSDATDGMNGVTPIYVSWTFRRAPKFFDVVTYTGTGNTPNSVTVSHNLGSTPGFIVTKAISAVSDWTSWHRSASFMLQLNRTDAASSTINNFAGFIDNVTSTSFRVNAGSSANDINKSGVTYVAYLFAHNAGGFGLTGTDNVISCGSFTTDGFGQAEVELGYEPQWVLTKQSSGSGDWSIGDSVRGMPYPQAHGVLSPNLSNAESAAFGPANSVQRSSTKFAVTSYPANSTFIYIAIRRGPMRQPDSGLKVFTPLTYTGNGADRTLSYGNSSMLGFDMSIHKARGTTAFSNLGIVNDMLRGFAVTTPNSQSGKYLATTNTDAEGGGTPYRNQTFTGVTLTSGMSSNTSGATFVNYFFRRAPGFFDEVCYTGTGSATTVAHNLGVAPDLMIVKNRGNAGSHWVVYSSALANTEYLWLESSAGKATQTAYWNSTSPTASNFTVGTGGGGDTNGASQNLVAYLFASCPGVSKVTNFTGTGALQTINCGFAGGARFVLIKRTDSTGDWYVWDSSRGLSSSNDPYLLLNSTAAEVTSTNWVDTTSTGFQVTAAAGNNVNINGASYIALAIA